MATLREIFCTLARRELPTPPLPEKEMRNTESGFFSRKPEILKKP
jgi:hypothetical protein